MKNLLRSLVHLIAATGTTCMLVVKTAYDCTFGVLRNVFLGTRIAMDRNLPWGRTIRELMCVDKEHTFEKFDVIETKNFPLHPRSDDIFVVTASVVRCRNCGKIYIKESREIIPYVPKHKRKSDAHVLKV